MEKKTECRNECLCTMYLKHFCTCEDFTSLSKIFFQMFMTIMLIRKSSQNFLVQFFEEIDIFPPGTIDCEDSGMSNYPGNNYKPLIGLTHKKALHRKVVTINLQDGNCACPSIIDHLLDI